MMERIPKRRRFSQGHLFHHVTSQGCHICFIIPSKPQFGKISMKTIQLICTGICTCYFHYVISNNKVTPLLTAALCSGCNRRTSYNNKRLLPDLLMDRADFHPGEWGNNLYYLPIYIYIYIYLQYIYFQHWKV